MSHIEDYADVDLHLSPDTWSAAFDGSRDFKFYSPYSEVRWLNRKSAGHAIARACYTMAGAGHTKPGNLSGGIFFSDRDAFHAIGRWDERFKKWGYEDTLLDQAAANSGLAIKIETAIATHLWHPALHRNQSRAIYEQNNPQQPAA